MAKRVDFSLAEKMKLVSFTWCDSSVRSEEERCFYIDRRCLAFLKRILFEISSAGAIVAENEIAKARRGCWECSVFVFRTETLGQGARVSGPLLKQKLPTCSYSRNGLHSCLLNTRS